MTRDPSDGTVRDAQTTQTWGEKHNKPNDLLSTDTSGLPTENIKAEELARLEKSRDWLRDKFNRASERASSGLRSPVSGEG